MITTVTKIQSLKSSTKNSLAIFDFNNKKANFFYSEKTLVARRYKMKNDPHIRKICQKRADSTKEKYLLTDASTSTKHSTVDLIMLVTTNG